ncbi:MAG: hypothetical protein COA99_00960 [Moraxellaceae bacterium]|nr:MAG: hypothetical protein COA99_00960 [Moraxellaceae bacterium]
MDLSQINAKIRPRNHYEAIDLGFVMARNWLSPLYALWFCISLPLFVALQVTFHQSPYISAMVIWWLKPLFDSLQLLYVSEKLFSNTVSFRKILMQAPRRLWHDAIVKLSIRRLSLTRSFDMPVGDLESLHGTQRNKRLNVLQRTTSSAAIWLTLVGMTIENIIVFAICGLVWMLVPPQLDIYIEFFDLITHPEVHRILSWCWYLAMGIVAPFYVTAGFSLYINRRTTLEAWDIELTFKDMATRAQAKGKQPVLKSSIASTFLAIIMVIIVISPSISSADQPLGELVTELSPHEAQQRMILIVESEAFNDIRSRERWQFKNKTELDDDDEKTTLPEWAEQLFNIIAASAEVLLWCLAIVCVLFILLRLRGIEIPFLEARKFSNAPPPSSLFGLALDQDSLPDNIIESARGFWRKSPRQAYSLLYRAALSDLVHVEALNLHHSHTEGECVRLFSKQNDHNPKSQFFQTLTEQWVMLAYGHQRVSHKQFDALCNEWPSHFPICVTEESGDLAP